MSVRHCLQFVLLRSNILQQILRRRTESSSLDLRSTSCVMHSLSCSNVRSYPPSLFSQVSLVFAVFQATIASMFTATNLSHLSSLNTNNAVLKPINEKSSSFLMGFDKTLTSVQFTPYSDPLKDLRKK